MNLRQVLLAAGLDMDAASAVAKVGRRADLPPALADEWAERWTGGDGLAELLALTAGDRLQFVHRAADDFLESTVNRNRRVNHAATQSSDPDLRAAGELAVLLRDRLVAFGRDVIIPVVSPFTGKKRLAVLTDLDVATGAAIIEVSTQRDAAGKVAQLAVLRGPQANPRALPVFHYFPNLSPGSVPARALVAAGSAGVYNEPVVMAADVCAAS